MSVDFSLKLMCSITPNVIVVVLEQNYARMHQSQQKSGTGGQTMENLIDFIRIFSFVLLGVLLDAVLFRRK